MTEDDARAWLVRHDVPRETIDAIAAFVDLLVAENEHQNLVARSTIEHIWARHIIDSAQLVYLSDQPERPWLDIGSGPGLPGIVIALLTGADTILVEPRRLRVAFLERAVAALGLAGRVTPILGKIEAVVLPAAPVNITARAFASLDTIFAATVERAAPGAIWVLPKGKSAIAELESARQTWQGAFHVERSVSDPDAAIVVARGVGRRRKAR